MTDDSVPRKQCSKCEQPFPATLKYFPSNRGHTDKLGSRCKPCTNAAQRERRIHPPVPVPDGYKRCSACNHLFPKTTEYFQANGKNRLRSDCKACRKAYVDRVVTPEKRLAYSRKYEALPEYREKRRQYVLAHPTRKNPIDILPEGHKRCTTCKGVFLATAEYFPIGTSRGKSILKGRCRKCDRKAIRENPTYNRTKRVYNRNRAIHKKAVQGTYTATQVEEQLKRQHYKCYYAACGYAKFPRIRENGTWKYVYEVEHTFPLSRVAGTDIPANDISYLVLSCESCNGKKGKKFPWEWPEGGRLL